MPKLLKRHADLARWIDHTLLKAETTLEDVRQGCQDARLYGFAGVCISPMYVKDAALFLEDSPVKVVTVVGFPLGATTSASKAFEAHNAVAQGVQEIDMVLAVGALLGHHDAYVLDDIKAVVHAAAPCGVKVILETALLNAAQKRKACALAQEAGAAFVKTSTGFGPAGACIEDIRLMRQVLGPGMGIKASGGIRTAAQAWALLDAGATRLGTSASVRLITTPSDPWPP